MDVLRRKWRAAVPGRSILVDLVLVRVLFVLIVAIACYFIQPFGRSATFDAGLGAVIGLAVIVFEWRWGLGGPQRGVWGADGATFLNNCVFPFPLFFFTPTP